MNKNIVCTVNPKMLYDTEAVTRNDNDIYVNVVNGHSFGKIEDQSTKDGLQHFENGSSKDIPFELYNGYIAPVDQRYAVALCIGLNIHPRKKYFPAQQRQ